MAIIHQYGSTSLDEENGFEVAAAQRPLHKISYKSLLTLGVVCGLVLALAVISFHSPEHHKKESESLILNFAVPENWARPSSFNLVTKNNDISVENDGKRTATAETMQLSEVDNKPISSELFQYWMDEIVKSAGDDERVEEPSPKEQEPAASVTGARVAYEEPPKPEFSNLAVSDLNYGFDSARDGIGMQATPNNEPPPAASSRSSEQLPASAVTQQSPVSAATQQLSSVTQQYPVSGAALQQLSSSALTQQSPVSSAGTQQLPSSAVTLQPPISAATQQLSSSAVTQQSPVSAAKQQLSVSGEETIFKEAPLSTLQTGAKFSTSSDVMGKEVDMESEFEKLSQDNGNGFQFFPGENEEDEGAVLIDDVFIELNEDEEEQTRIAEGVKTGDDSETHLDEERTQSDENIMGKEVDIESEFEKLSKDNGNSFQFFPGENEEDKGAVFIDEVLIELNEDEEEQTRNAEGVKTGDESETNVNEERTQSYENAQLKLASTERNSGTTDVKIFQKVETVEGEPVAIQESSTVAVEKILMENPTMADVKDEPEQNDEVVVVEDEEPVAVWETSTVAVEHVSVEHSTVPVMKNEPEQDDVVVVVEEEQQNAVGFNSEPDQDNVMVVVEDSDAVMIVEGEEVVVIDDEEEGQPVIVVEDDPVGVVKGEVEEEVPNVVITDQDVMLEDQLIDDAITVVADSDGVVIVEDEEVVVVEDQDEEQPSAMLEDPSVMVEDQPIDDAITVVADSDGIVIVEDEVVVVEDQDEDQPSAMLEDPSVGVVEGEAEEEVPVVVVENEEVMGENEAVEDAIMVVEDTDVVVVVEEEEVVVMEDQEEGNPVVFAEDQNVRVQHQPFAAMDKYPEGKDIEVVDEIREDGVENELVINDAGESSGSPLKEDPEEIESEIEEMKPEQKSETSGLSSVSSRIARDIKSLKDRSQTVEKQLGKNDPQMIELTAALGRLEAMMNALEVLESSETASPEAEQEVEHQVVIAYSDFTKALHAKLDSLSEELDRLEMKLAKRQAKIEKTEKELLKEKAAETWQLDLGI